jgi:hypothetical protein
MATNKKKKAVKVQDMKPAKDAKGGVRAPVRQRGPVDAGRTVAGRTEH